MAALSQVTGKLAAPRGTSEEAWPRKASSQASPREASWSWGGGRRSWGKEELGMGEERSIQGEITQRSGTTYAQSLLTLGTMV